MERRKLRKALCEDKVVDLAHFRKQRVTALSLPQRSERSLRSYRDKKQGESGKGKNLDREV